MVPPWLNTYMNSRSFTDAKAPLVNWSAARHSPLSSVAGGSVVAAGRASGRRGASRTGSGRQTIDSGRINRSLQGKNPLDDPIQLGIGHLRVGSHRNLAPVARAALLHLRDQGRLGVLAPVACRHV